MWAFYTREGFEKIWWKVASNYNLFYYETFSLHSFRQNWVANLRLLVNCQTFVNIVKCFWNCKMSFWNFKLKRKLNMKLSFHICSLFWFWNEIGGAKNKWKCYNCLIAYWNYENFRWHFNIFQNIDFKLLYYINSHIAFAIKGYSDHSS